MIHTISYMVIFLLGLSAAIVATAEDMQQQEKIISQRLTSRAVADEVIYLTTSGSEFIGLYNSTRNDKASGTVILAHGIGGHPDWPDVISPLRTQLTRFGWSTFAIQMPTLPVDEPITRYGRTLITAQQRLKAAVEYLHAWGIEDIVLLGYGFGASQIASYLASEQDTERLNIKAFISISMPAQRITRPRLDIFKTISNINIPILDIYAEHDLAELKIAADDRRLAARKSHSRGFRKIELQGADNHYLGTEEALLEQIQEWLQQVAPNTNVEEKTR